MSESLVKILGFALLAAVLAGMLRILGWRGVPVFVSFAFMGIVSLVGDSLLSVVSEMNYLACAGGIEDYVETATKIIAVGFLSAVIGDVLQELGEGGLSKAVTIASRLEIIALSMPYFRQIVDMGLAFLA